MGFLNSGFLYYLGFAIIPIIIHILNKQRYKRVNWAAMEFLRLALQKVRRRIQLEELILLIIRTLIIVFLIGAFAKPYLKLSANLPILTSTGKYYILVLDDTLSMNVAVKGISNFQRAKDNLIGFVDFISKNAQNKISLILFKSPIEELVREPISDFERVKQIITSISVSKTSGNIKGLFSKVEELVKDEREKTNDKEVYFLTDLQKIHWEKVIEDEEFRESIKNIFNNNARLFIIDFGSSEYHNLTINKLFSNNRVIFKGIENQFFVSVKNNSLKSTEVAKLDVVVDQIKVGDKNITLPPSAVDNSISFNHTFVEHGPHYIQARLSADDLVEDNTFSYVFNIPEKINILIVNGNPNSFDKSRDDAFYLSRMINHCQVYGTSVERQECEKVVSRPYRWEIIYPDQLESSVLSVYDLVILSNVVTFGERELEKIKNYLQEGGVVVFFLGDKINASWYNNMLSYHEIPPKSSDYLLPCKLGEKKDYAGEGGDVFLRISYIDISHPMIIPYKDQFKKYLTSKLVFSGLWEMKCLQSDDYKNVISFRTVLSYNDNNSTPLLFESSYGKGAILWFNTTANTYWFTDMLRGISFGLIHKFLEYAISRKSEHFNVFVGDSFSYIVRSDSILGTLNVKTPSGSQISLSPVRIDQRSNTYLVKVQDSPNEGLKEQGIYEVKGSSSTKTINFLVGVNVDPLEGDLQKVAIDDIKKINQSIVVMDNISAVDRSQNIGKAAYRNIVKALLYTIITLLFLEVLLAHIFNLRRM